MPNCAQFVKGRYGRAGGSGIYLLVATCLRVVPCFVGPPPGLLLAHSHCAPDSVTAGLRLNLYIPDWDPPGCSSDVSWLAEETGGAAPRAGDVGCGRLWVSVVCMPPCRGTGCGDEQAAVGRSVNEIVMRLKHETACEPV